MSRRARLGWSILILGLYLLHQDLWFWRQARPLVLGFLPIGLAYHAVYCLAVTFLMWGLTRYAWPAHLENPLRLNRRPDEGSSR
ncbi:hypothetical protein BH24ACI4_BH24ACI4_22560 [soil metagenome]